MGAVSRSRSASGFRIWNVFLDKVYHEQATLWSKRCLCPTWSPIRRFGNGIRRLSNDDVAIYVTDDDSSKMILIQFKIRSVTSAKLCSITRNKWETITSRKLRRFPRGGHLTRVTLQLFCPVILNKQLPTLDIWDHNNPIWTILLAIKSYKIIQISYCLRGLQVYNTGVEGEEHAS